MLPTLPALRGLSALADCRPCIVIDFREQTPLPIRRLPVVRGTLTTGDYSFSGGQELFSIERKSISDLIGCCCGENRERFERELHRLRGFRFARLLIVGRSEEITHHLYKSNVLPKVVFHTLYAFEARYIPVVFSPTPESAARLIERLAWWAARELCEQTNELLRGTKQQEKDTRHE
jgi:DNA excision repair protein ERCC-4